MFRLKTRLLVLLVDIIVINVAFFGVFWFRFQSGIMNQAIPVGTVFFIKAGIIITLLWLLLFLVAGLYKDWYAESRFDEVVLIIKTVTVGVFILFFITIDPTRPINLNRVTLFIFWFSLVGLVSLGRMIIRSTQRYLLIQGVGQRPSLVVGFNETGKKMVKDIEEYPALGYRVVGFVDRDDKQIGQEHLGVPVLGTYQQLSGLIGQHSIQELLITVRPSSHEEILEILSFCQGIQINYNIVPDLYEILSGHVKTNAIYGFPLMKMLPDFMPAWERNAKRLLDLLVSIIFLVGFAPVWVLVGILIKLDSQGPVFFSQTRVGKNRKLFTIYKFRSMVQDAEKHTGPVWAADADPRITRIGRILRKTRIDEIPQLINVLRGDMSLVGPRPERPYFVEQLEREIPIYVTRFNVKPGISGLAQTKHRYDASLDDVREKMKFDLYYIENMSLTLDLKILLRTIYVVLTARGAR
jgi:exopolysaccharide biosynthesis polyprenyl glycosylphosphotransferase